MGIIDLLKKDITQQELLNYYNITIQYETLPKKIDGCVFQYKGFFVIFIDKDLSYYKKRKTILHELAHIELAQLEQSDKDLLAFHSKEYEDEADEYIKLILNKIKEDFGWTQN